MEIRPFRSEDEETVIALWQRCELLRPWNDPHKDIRRKLWVQPELFLVGEQEGRVIASAMGGYDGHRGWVYYFGVDPAHQRQGHARALLAELVRRLRALGCPKLNLQVRTSNLGAVEFYRRVGCKMDEVVSLGLRLEED
jgi:ribosomal protein S18 acetylase RimI-like enzyme